MKCKLCKDKDADKKNTHYLTDGIIKSCLNIEGTGTRETGLFFDFSSDIAFIEPGFQRNSSVEVLEDKLGRTPTEEEIEKARHNPFSVDNVFCSSCEDIFKKIETEFINDVLPKLRNSNLDDVDVKEFDDIKTIRMFFYIQIWRTSVCREEFQLREETEEELRQMILKYDQVSADDINHFPLAITYLNTIGGEKEYTRNSVGFTDDRNPHLLLMNDFMVQFYEDSNSIEYFDFHGLNDKDKYQDFINLNENKIKIRIINNQDRIRLVGTIRYEEKLKKLRPAFKNSFKKLWNTVFGGLPSQKNIEDYLELIFSKAENEAMQFSRERILEITRSFILTRSAVDNNKDAFRRLERSL